MPKKEKIPPPGNKKDEFTNFYTKAKWKQFLLKSSLDIPGRNTRFQGAQIIGNALAKNRWVTAIDLSHNHIGDRGAIELAQFLKVNEYLQSINLSVNEITDVGAIALASAFIPYANPTGQPSQWNRSVYYLNLSGNKLKDDSLVALANAAACHRDLTRVDLQYNAIGPLGCKAFMRSMQRNNLCSFILGGNMIGDDGTAALCAAWKRFGGKGSQASLNLSRNDVCRIGAEAVGNLLLDNDFVEDVNLSLNTIACKGAQLIVSKMLPPHKCVVRILNLQQNMLEDEGAEEVARVVEANLETLQKINVSHNQIREKGGLALMNALMKNTFLTMFMAGNNEMSKDKVVEAVCVVVQSTKTLKLLDLKRNSFTEEQKQKLSDSLKNTQSSGFRMDYGAMDDVLPMTEYLSKLKEWVELHKPEEEKPKEKKKKGKK